MRGIVNGRWVEVEFGMALTVVLILPVYETG